MWTFSRAFAVAGCAAVICAGGMPTRAAVITTTYTGAVPDVSEQIPGGPSGQFTNIDYYGFFGAPGASLQGLPFTAIYTTDEATPGATSTVLGANISGATTAKIQIGSAEYAVGPAGGGSTYTYGPPNLDVYSNLARGPCTPTPEAHHCTDIAGSFYLVWLWNQVVGVGGDFLPSPNQYYTPFSHVVLPGESTSLNLFLVNDHAGHWQYIDLPVQLITNLVEGVVSPPIPPGPPPPSLVPEPSSWAMLIVGFLGLGAMLRSRRSEQAVNQMRRRTAG